MAMYKEFHAEIQAEFKALLAEFQSILGGVCL